MPSSVAPPRISGSHPPDTTRSGVDPHEESSPQAPYLAGLQGVLLLGMGRSSAAFTREFERLRVEVSATSSGRGAARLAERLRPALVLVGPEAGRDPSRVLKRIREAPGFQKVLVLAPSADPVRAAELVEQGADDVLPPPHSFSSVLLRAVLLTSNPRGPWAAGAGGFGSHPDVVAVDGASRRIICGDETRLLTGREFQLLERLVQASGDVVARRTLLDDIWGDAAGTEAVLDATVHRLRQKLEFDPNRPEILSTQRGVGYRLDPNRVHLNPAPAPSRA